jgi:hypothetical protein
VSDVVADGGWLQVVDAELSLCAGSFFLAVVALNVVYLKVMCALWLFCSATGVGTFLGVEGRQAWRRVGGGQEVGGGGREESGIESVI